MLTRAGASCPKERTARVRSADRVRAAHPRLGGLILAVVPDAQSTEAWQRGAIGEERLGARLDTLPPGVAVLHDRRIPGIRANIDHLAVTSSGIYVIDTKRYQGRAELKIEGGLIRPKVEKLLVGRRDCTALVDGVHKQVTIVQASVGPIVPANGVLCFVDADWPAIGGAITIRDIRVLGPRRLIKLIRRSSTGPVNVPETSNSSRGRFRLPDRVVIHESRTGRPSLLAEPPFERPPASASPANPTT